MRVISKLAQIDFQFGSISRQNNLLVIESDADARMPTTVYISPQDVVEALKRILVSPGGLLFLLALPVFWFRWRRSDQSIQSGTKKTREWPTV